MSTLPFQPGQAQNDLGGMPAGPVVKDEHAPTLFEKRVDALFRLLVEPPRNFFWVDAQRRVFETVPSGDYETLAYYELWIESIRLLLIERGVLSQDEIDRKCTEIRARYGLREGAAP